MNPEYAVGYSNFLYRKKVSKSLYELFSSTKVNAVWNGTFKLPGDKNKLPVVIFSHGLGANRTAYSLICCDLASKGVLVAAVEHADKSACATYYLKKVTPGKPEVQKIWINYQLVDANAAEEHYLRNKQVHYRADECSAVLSELQHLNDGQAIYAHCEIDLKPFKGAIDVNKCAVMGHSFGGGTAVTALSKDDRFKVGIGLDTWMYPLDSEIYQKVSPVPFLFINTESFQWAANIADMRKLDADVFDVSAERQMVTLVGTHHFSQTDFPFILKKKMLMSLFNATNAIDPIIAIRLNNQLAFGFLGKYLGLEFGNSVQNVVSENANLVYFGSNVDIDEDRIKKAKQKLLSVL